ncbi:uncharacterized protein LOC107781256 [Nicotiana tabacum]|uniref:Uncharacterized protein LOC107781256 n=2 Tax=Nicotiana TaxID=4085 RepID=A0A1S3Z000_TOBAC|nr:PREDICTED: uncharacterized protein LOC104245052 [Nicotiana sylvestris]XP_016457422.1 PREDICTED: uncharacterized protein LOC107781256 [Nicotiana tabacum]
MALTAGSNAYSLSRFYVQAADTKEIKVTTKKETWHGRRELIFSTVIAAVQVNDSKTELLQRYLKKSEENKAKNDKERLDSYYKRNYGDYFGFLEGDLKQKKEQLTEAEQGILKWLETNK